MMMMMMTRTQLYKRCRRAAVGGISCFPQRAQNLKLRHWIVILDPLLLTLFWTSGNRFLRARKRWWFAVCALATIDVHRSKPIIAGFQHMTTKRAQLRGNISLTSDSLSWPVLTLFRMDIKNISTHNPAFPNWEIVSFCINAWLELRTSYSYSCHHHPSSVNSV